MERTKLKKYFIVLFLIITSLLFFSCDFIFIVDDIIDILQNEETSDNSSENSDYKTTVSDKIPTSIKERVVYYATLYRDSDTEYKYGGQDPLRSIKVDCSGLIIRCYQYALEGTEYELLRNDMSSSYIYESASNYVTEPEPGDLVFMGDTNSSKINHIGIFTKKIGNTIYFIDSTEYAHGVSEHSYDINNSKIKSFGEMKLKLK